MKILITGGLGFVGTNLANYLLDNGHTVIAVGRAATQNRITSDRYQYISADTSRPGDWQAALGDVDVALDAGQARALGVNMCPHYLHDSNNSIF